MAVSLPLSQSAGASVLIVEPDSSSAAELARIFKSAGFKVATARAGAEALRSLRDDPPGLLICASLLADTTGPDLCEEVRSSPAGRGVRTILISTESGSKARLSALERGADAFITRPYHPAEVLVHASRLLKTERPGRGSVGARGGVSGELAEMPIIDLVQFLEMGRRTGVIEVRRSEAEPLARVLIRDGRIIDAEFGDERGREALMTVLGFQSGQFGFRARAVSESAAIQESTTALLMEALRRKDERDRILQVLPPLETVLFRNIDPSLGPLAERPLAELRDLCDGRRSLRQVLAASGREEIATMVMLKDLLDRQYLVAAPAGRSLEEEDLNFCPRCGSLALPGGRRCPECGARLRASRVGSEGDLIERTRRLLGDRYDIQKVLGEGGLGVVFKARDRMLDVDLAIKVLRPEFCQRPEDLDRIRKEIVVARRLTHPHIIRIHDLGEREGLLYITMEYVFGKNLLEYLESDKRWIQSQGNQLVALVKDVLQALDYAHKQGVIHRDIKPQNILIDINGHVRVADFGLAIQAERALDLPGGPIVGTPEYISPEQAQGGPVDARSDLYSVGVLMYQMFTGILPFQAQDRMSTMFQRIMEDPLPPRAVNPALGPEVERVILTAMSRDPAGRYPSAAGLLADLTRIEEENLFPSEQGAPPPELAHPLPPLPAAGIGRRDRLPPARRQTLARSLAVVLAAVALIAFSVIGLGVRSRSHVSSLLAQARNAIAAGELDRAAGLLEQVGRIDPENAGRPRLARELEERRAAARADALAAEEAALTDLLEAGDIAGLRAALGRPDSLLAPEPRRNWHERADAAAAEALRIERRRLLESRIGRGRTALRAGDAAAAAAAFTAALQLQSDSPEAVQGLAEAREALRLAEFARLAEAARPEGLQSGPISPGEEGAELDLPPQLKGRWLRRAEPGGRSAQIGIMASGGRGPLTVTLHVRDPRRSDTLTVPMENLGQERYAADLPPDLGTTVDYYVEAVDQSGRSARTDERRATVSADSQ